MLYYRHTLPVRIMHWINVLALTILLLRTQHLQRASGTVLGQIVLHRATARSSSISAREDANGDPVGITRIFGHDFVTTGLLGASAGADGELVPRRLSVLADDSRPALAGDGAALASVLCLGLRAQRAVLPRLYGGHAGIWRATSRPRQSTGARSEARSSTICASGTRRARPRSATTCCRSSPTWR